MISTVLADIKADSTLNSLLSGRVYRSLLPDNPVYPLILFETEREIQNTLGGPSTLQRFIFDYIIMGANYVQCKSIYEALDNALLASSNFKHTMLSSDDGEFNDEIEQYIINAQSSIWGV